MSFATYSHAAYARVAVESGVAVADPHRLVAMLFDGAIAALARARVAMLQKEHAVKGAACSKAIDIVELGLAASLDPHAGGEIAEQLRALYEYIARRIVMGNARNDPAALDEAIRLLDELRGA